MSAAARRMAHAHIGLHPEESARVLERLEPLKIAELLRDAPTESVATVISKFAPAVAGACVACLPAEERSAVLALLPVPIAAALLRPVEAGPREEALGALPEGSRKALDRALSYPEHSAGALADPSAVVLHADLTVEEATDRLREQAGTAPPRIFVLDRSQRLVGAVTPATLLGGSPKATVGSLDIEVVRAVAAGVDAATLVARERPEDSIAVVNTEGTFLGAIDERTLRGQRVAGVSRSLIHPAAAIGELYWLGLRELFGGLSSGSRVGGGREEVNRANG